MKMDLSKGSARCSRLEIMLLEKKMNIKNSVLDYIRYRQLNWYGHVQRKNEERLPRKMLEWCPLGRRKEILSKFVDAGSYNRNEREGN